MTDGFQVSWLNCRDYLEFQLLRDLEFKIYFIANMLAAEVEMLIDGKVPFYQTQHTGSE